MASRLILDKPSIIADVEHLCELDIRYTHLDVKCKSLLDKVIIDPENRKAYVIDLKTTFTPDVFVTEVINNYGYVQQIGLYPDIDFEIEGFLVAVGTGENGTVKVVKLGTKTLNNKITFIETLLEIAKYHIKTGNWDYSKEYYTGEGYELFGED